MTIIYIVANKFTYTLVEETMEYFVVKFSQ